MSNQPIYVPYSWEEGPRRGGTSSESALAAYQGALGGTPQIWRSVFAEQGPLGLCEHGLPFTHSWVSEFVHPNAWLMAEAEFRYVPKFPELCLPLMAESIRDLEAWTRFFSELSTRIESGSGEALQWPECADLDEVRPGPRSRSEALARGLGTTSALEAQVQTLWRVADVSPRLGLDEDGIYRVRMSRLTTFAELAFLSVAVGSPEGAWEELVTCHNCGEELSGRSGRGADQMAWCESAECRRVRKRIYNQRYRNRKKP